MRRIYFLFFFILPFYSYSQFTSIELEVRSVPEPSERESSVDTFNESQPGFKDLSLQSRAFFYWVNYCRYNPRKFWEDVVTPVLRVFPPMNTKEAISLKEDLLKTGTLPMFLLNAALIKTSQMHATDISYHKSPPSHNSTNGTSFGSRIQGAGINSCAGENIAVSGQSVLLSVILLYLDIGLPELGHRKSLLNPGFLETGIGSAAYGKEKNVYFIVQDLSCAQ